MVGKQSVPFTQEGATSSKELITIDRSNLVNNIWFTQEYMPGVSISGRAAPWIYRGGLYSSGAMNREFGRFNGDMFTLGLVGYDFAKKLGVREAVLTANYLYQHPDENNTFTKRFEHIASLHFRLEEPRWGLRTDLSKTAGYLGQSDLWAVMLMPYFNATDKLQFVTRYTMVTATANNGISLNTYENRVVTGARRSLQRGLPGRELLLLRPPAETAERRAVRGYARSCQRRRRLQRHVVDDRAAHRVVGRPIGQ